MLGTITLATVLDMFTVDSDEYEDCLYVRDTLDHKRGSEHYPALLDAIRRDGMQLPININTWHGAPHLTDGHHRVAAAVDLGMTHLIWSDLPLDVDGGLFTPTSRNGWGPYRPAA